MCIFAMLGTVMFISKIVMELLPNIHLLGTLTVVYTLVYRKRALIPIYVYVLLNGVYSGFSLWWMPYVYIWTLLWGAVMLLPSNMPKRAAIVVYPTVSMLHGLLFGLLYAPAQRLMFGLDFEQTLAWIASGFVFDVIHAIGNFALGFLVLPLANILKKLSNGKYA